ncbi:hypothetical protein FRC12_000613 [Ceratobasidium sp. 428]|nr:hypothetical protein FRC12_000613 [Ceratobasidium sp. 428]
MSRPSSIAKHSDADAEDVLSVDQDQQQLQSLGYTPTLKRTLGIIESFASGICANNFMCTVRAVFFLGMLAGGPVAMWPSFLIVSAFMCTTAVVLRETCSALPISGSIYVWAAHAAGPRYSRFVGCIVAWWVTTNWISSTAATSQGNANYLLSLIAAYELDFPGGISDDNIKWRATVWITSEILLLLAVSLNYLPTRLFSRLLRLSIVLMILDFLLCAIWLPVGVNKTYGFRSPSEALLTQNNGTGAPPVWNIILSILFAAGSQGGFDAAGHVAEETKNASIVAAQSIFTSALAAGIGGFATTILFLFCSPDIKTLFSLHAPQPFVLIYTMALGRGGGTFMTILAVISTLCTHSVIVLAASRLVFAIARDGALPLSSWVSKVSASGHPHNAVTVVYIVSAILLCSILPSTVAFVSLISGGYLPLLASYGTIALLRLTRTPHEFKSSRYSLGVFSKPLYIVTILGNGIMFAVFTSPNVFPVTAKSLNFVSLKHLYGVVCSQPVIGAGRIWDCNYFWSHQLVAYPRRQMDEKGADTAYI